MIVLRAVRFGLALGAVMLASPASASDFSGMREIFLAAIVIVVTAFAAPFIFLSRIRKFTSRTGDAAYAAITSLTLAPAIYVQQFDEFGENPEWLFSPLPGLLFAATEGSARALFPAPIISMTVCAIVIFLLLQKYPVASGQQQEGER